MRTSHRVKKARANVVNVSTRITELEEKRKDKIANLQDICQHEYISEYHDGKFWEGRRICEICFLEEQYGESGYKILKTDRVRKINIMQLCEIRRMES